MRNKVIWSFLSLIALGVGGLVAGCDSDAKITKSAEGDSCTKTSDCNDGLRCEQGTCYKATSHMDTGGAGETGNGGTPGVVGPTPPVLGGEGESCTKRADCEDGLACLSQRCQKDVAMGTGGEGTAGPSLGGPGETCGLTSDCTKGLVCLPSDGPVFDIKAKAIGSNSVGVCSVVDNGLEATGKDCNSECLTPADCCELPVELHASLIAESCADLAELLDGVACDTAVAGTLNASRCFAQATYCECGKTTWACTEGQCVYTAACTKAAFNTPGGCPTFTRSGTSLATPCDTTGTKKCTPEAAPAGCKTDAQCDAKVVADSPPLAPETCATGECTCFKATGACYRKCNEDLDCPLHYTCDMKTTVCVADTQCTSDAQCVTTFNDINYKCLDGICDVECDNDRDCNGGSLTEGAFTQVCTTEKRCKPAGCTKDSECPGKPGNNARMFCGDTPAFMSAAGIHSATTD
jgi:hypothetical protein